MFFLLMSYTALIIPTGRYFVSLGSSEVLVLTFWYIIGFLFIFIRFSFIFLNNFFKNI
jgi:hypothetical protein